MEQIRAAYLATLTEWPAGRVATLRTDDGGRYRPGPSPGCA
jgi:hypothetical protein